MVDWQAKWNERYATGEFAYGKEPNRFLAEAEPAFSGKDILCVADGEGRNGVWLAQKGYNVTSIDYAQAGIDKINRFAEAQGVSIKTYCADLFKISLKKETFDGVVVIYSHFNENDSTVLFEKYKYSLKSNGIIIFEVYSKNQLGNTSGGPRNIDLLYDINFIKNSFKDMEMIRCEEKEITLAEGPLHQGKANVIRMIAKKR